MMFRETIRRGLVLRPKRELCFHKRHDTNSKTTLGTTETMVVWDFERFSEDDDPYCEVEVEMLCHADLWAFPVPRGEHLTDYFEICAEEEE